MIEYQLFTKCNLKCPYCYNFFEQGVQDVDSYIDDFLKISSLADRKTCMVINGGEPLLLKNIAKLINSVQVQTNMLTYTNGTLPLKVYEKFIKDVRLDNLYFTVSFHYAELLRTKKFNDKYVKNVKYLIENIPNLKFNIVFTPDFDNKEFLDDLLDILLDFQRAGLKYINILLEDSLKDNRPYALKLVSTAHFRSFMDELRVFKYKHCMWNNPKDNVSCLYMWLKKECLSPQLPYKELSFLKLEDGFIIQSNFGFKSDNVIETKTTNLDAVVEDARIQLE